MRADTKKRKNATQMLRATQEQEWWADQVVHVMLEGKRALDAAMLDVGRLVAETLMYMEREERSGPDYHPTSSGLRKWASQRGSIYVGDQKLPVEHPRLRGPEGEVGLRTYEQLKNRGGFSEELLSEVLRGMSARKYEETVTAVQERSLEEFPLFAMYLDTVHRGGQAFVVALGVDREGKKLPLGFWEGATENHEICEELLEELERRGLKLSKRILWVTDGGGGIIKALKDRYGKKLIHQRCTLHKDRNIQRHLPKRYRKQAHHLFATALEQNSYKDAKKMLQEFERWLRDINESAADSLLEALEEVLMLHKLKVPALLRQSLHSTNPIESMFSMVRSCERNIKRYRNSKMRQRWLAAVLLHCEQQFRRVKGHASIDVVVAAIDAIQREDEMPER